MAPSASTSNSSETDQALFLSSYLPCRVGEAHEFLLDQTILLHCTARRASSVCFLRGADLYNLCSNTMAIAINTIFISCSRSSGLESGEDLSTLAIHSSIAGFERLIAPSISRYCRAAQQYYMHDRVAPYSINVLPILVHRTALEGDGFQYS